MYYMAKTQKTVKALTKRFKLTGTGKIKKIAGGVNHFNATKSGKTVRNKRHDGVIENKKNQKLIKKFSA